MSTLHKYDIHVQQCEFVVFSEEKLMSNIWVMKRTDITHVHDVKGLYYNIITSLTGTVSVTFLRVMTENSCTTNPYSTFSEASSAIQLNHIAELFQLAPYTTECKGYANLYKMSRFEHS